MTRLAPITKSVPHHHPSLHHPRQTAFISDWCVVGRILMGIVFNHPRHVDGRRIRTSKLLAIDYEAGIATTVDTDYTLGEPLNL